VTVGKNYKYTFLQLIYQVLISDWLNSIYKFSPLNSNIKQLNEEEQARHELIRNILGVIIGIVHPITQGVYNLCEHEKKGTLSSLKVKKLKEICAYFEITTKSKDKKCHSMDKVAKMINNCTCIKKLKLTLLNLKSFFNSVISKS